MPTTNPLDLYRQSKVSSVKPSKQGKSVGIRIIYLSTAGGDYKRVNKEWFETDFNRSRNNSSTFGNIPKMLVIPAVRNKTDQAIRLLPVNSTDSADLTQANSGELTGV